jgi:MtN3 and saliva related transmembrane protein
VQFSLSPDLLGLLAGTLTTAAFVPQVVQAWRTHSTRDISAAMFVTFSLGVALWLWYGVVLGAWPIILANVVTLALSLVILYLKLRYK